MKCRLAGLVVAAQLAAGCQDATRTPESPSAPAQSAKPAPKQPAPAPESTAYAADISRVCDVVSLAGASTVETADRAYLIAQWLGANLTTRESREFLVRIQPLQGEPKAQALVDEARRVGLADCALAAEWRRPI